MRVIAVVLCTVVILGVSVALPYGLRWATGAEHHAIAGVLAVVWGFLCARLIGWYLLRLRARAELGAARDRARQRVLRAASLEARSE